MKSEFIEWMRSLEFFSTIIDKRFEMKSALDLNETARVFLSNSIVQETKRNSMNNKNIR